MSGNIIKPQIFKTEDFFVEKRTEKKMYLLRKSEILFNRIANAIDFQIKIEKKELRKKKISNKQRETRISKRTYYYEFYLFENDFDFKKVERENISFEINLNKNDFIINNENVGIFRGSEIVLLELLNTLYE